MTPALPVSTPREIDALLRVTTTISGTDVPILRGEYPGEPVSGA